ncbi:MAG: hypothetical protein HY466_07175 [Deltaproteobacteria bacterium]|nr:hypothetical protein [Deltaproteobacteria bacterium]
MSGFIGSGWRIFCGVPGAFDGHLHFNIHLLAHQGDDKWVEPAILAAKQCLMSDALPEPNAECEFCGYRREGRGVEV